MAESKIKDDNYFLVSGWMLNRLKLKGVPLQVFSIIYGFSQDGEGSFTGSLQYLCDFTNSSKNTILKALKELTEKGYIAKTENFINGVRFCTYKIAPLVQKLHYGGSVSEPGGGAEIAPGGGSVSEPNKEDIDNKDYISKDIVDEVISLYHSLCPSFPSLRAVSDARKKKIRVLLGKYTVEDFQKVFENAEASSFLKGENGSWKASFDWMLKEDKFVAILEDNYADRPGRSGRKENIPGWLGQRELDDDEGAAIRRMMMSEADQAEADQLRQELQAAFGGR